MRELWEASGSGGLASMLMLSSFLALGVNFSQFLVLGRFSAVTFQVCSNGRLRWAVQCHCCAVHLTAYWLISSFWVEYHLPTTNRLNSSSTPPHPRFLHLTFRCFCVLFIPVPMESFHLFPRRSWDT